MAIHRKQAVYDIIQQNPLLYTFYRTGSVTYQGGTEVRVPVVLQETVNTSEIGTYETFATTPENGPETARYPNWFKRRASIVFDETELGQNEGKHKLLDLLQTKKQIMQISLANEIEAGLHNGNAGAANVFDGLIADALFTSGFIQFRTEATQAGTTGGLDRAVYSKWRNKYQTISAFSVDGMTSWLELYMECSEQGTHPNLIVTDPAVYRFYDRYVSPNQQRRDKAMWDAGFENVLFRGTPVVPDPELAGTGRSLFLTMNGKRMVDDFNMKPEHFSKPGKNPLARSTGAGIGLQLAILRKDDFRMTPFRYPANSDTLLQHTFFTSMLCCSSLARQGASAFSGTVQY
jgi:hypothetical protein